MREIELIELDKPVIYNSELCERLQKIKCKIDDVDDWDKMKKLTNPYELIHCSTNNCHAIRSINIFNPISRSFFKLVELMKDYDLCNSKEPITIVSIAEGPGGFIESFIKRESYTTNDNIYGITLTPTTKYIPNWDKLNKLYNTSNINTSYGDIYDLNTINSFISNINGKVDFITADGGFDYSNDFNTQETQSCRIILAEIIICFKKQKQGGDFVCKFFDIFNILTMKLIYILKQHYDNIFINKPVTSRPANSERYIVCKGFKGVSSDILGNLEYILSNWKEDKIYDIGGITMDEGFIKNIKTHNLSFVNNQIKYLEKTLGLIKNNPTKYEYNKIIASQVMNAVNWCKSYNMNINNESKYLTRYNID